MTAAGEQGAQGGLGDRREQGDLRSASAQPDAATVGSPPPDTRPAGTSRAPSRRTLLLAAAAAVVLLGDAWLLRRVLGFRAEARQARVDTYGATGAAANSEMALQKARLQSVRDRVRADAQADRSLHLSVEVESGTVTLARDGLVLRTMAADLGPESLVGVSPDTQRLAVPLGVRAVQRLVAKGEKFELPAWLYRERGVELPAERRVKGALGHGAVILEGGTLLYATPVDGPLADSLYIWPGAIRLSVADLKAVLPNLKAGVRVYLY